MEITFIQGTVPAGFPSPAQDYAEERIDLKKLLQPNEESTYIIKVMGDSMKDAFIADGSLLVVDRSLPLKSGNIILAEINGEFTVKRYMKRKEGYFLEPANPRYNPIKIEQEMGFQHFGVVTFIITEARKV